MKIYLETRIMKILSSEDINYINSSLTGAFLTTNVEEAKEAEVIIGFPINLKGDIRETFPAAKVVLLLSAGYDDFDLSQLNKYNIRLASANGSSSDTIAEHVIGHLLSVNYNLGESLINQQNKVWKRNFNRIELGGASVLVLGTGSIGQAIAKRLKAFNTTIYGYNRTKREVEGFDYIYSTKAELNALYPNTDYLIIALPLNKDTYHFVNKEVLSLLPKRAMLINIGRGHVIDEEALIRTMSKRSIRAALLDVTQKEPLPEDSPLWTLPNVYITPHIAFFSNKYAANLCELLITNIQNIQNNKPLLNEVKL